MALKVSSVRVVKLKEMLKERGEKRGERTDRKRPVKETGFESSSRGAVKPRSGEARSSGEGEEESESNLSSCFDLRQEKRPFDGGGVAFSFSADMRGEKRMNS